jgi:hypothetical protein
VGLKEVGTSLFPFLAVVPKAIKFDLCPGEGKVISWCEIKY